MAANPLSIYIADDEQGILDVVKLFLESEGYQVQAFARGDLLMQAFTDKPADLVILDVMMPGLSGFEVCSELRKISTVPIIMLTARDSELDYATGINLGSDDYFTKPFSAMSLVLRVKAIFRRVEFERGLTQPEEHHGILEFADLQLDPRGKKASLAGKSLELTPNEFSLLEYLLVHRDRAIPRDELLEKLWGFNSEVETRAADDTVRRLRKKLSDGRIRVETVWGYGFRLKEDAR